MDDEECPGERACALGQGPLFGEIQLRVSNAKEGMKMARDLPPDLVAHTCKRCPLLPTKAGKEPPWLQFIITEVARLEMKKAIGVTFPDGQLTPRQLAMLDGAMRGRNRSDKNRLKKSKPNNPSTNKPQIPPGMGQLD